MIITDEKLLRQKCTDAKPEEASELISMLERELAHSAEQGRPGIGLAAIQCGVPKNVAIVRVGNELNVNLVNCKIEKQYDPIMFSNEGCLSLPDKLETTMRYNEIYVVNNLVFPHSFICAGLGAVVVQHELDHCNAILMQDRAINKSKKKPKPNDPCPCGSNLKYKRCCALQTNKSLI